MSHDAVHTQIGERVWQAVIQRGIGIDCTLSDAGDDYRALAHPHDIRFPKSYATPWRFDNATLRPLDFDKPPAKVEKIGNGVRYTGAYDGIDVYRVCTPEGAVEEFTVTSAAGQRTLSWEVTGDFTLAPPFWMNDSGGGEVPYTLVGGTLTFDLSSVPVGAVVR